MLSYLMVFILVLLTPLSTSMAKGATKIDFVDTSGYESLAEIYKDYFKFGCGCEAVSHWNYGTTNVNKEIGTPEKEAVISMMSLKNAKNSLMPVIKRLLCLAKMLMLMAKI